MNHVNRFDKISWFLLLAMMLIALTNAIRHNPIVGYDAGDYSAYIASLAEGELPDRDNNDEFFTPPLPFVLPAILKAIFNIQHSATLKVAQFINVLVALGTAFVLARIVNRLTQGNDISRNLALAFFLGLPVFYKTYAFVRAEPYLVLFILLYIEQLILLIDKQIKLKIFSIQSGLLFGAIILSRQWGILILPAVFLFALLLIISKKERMAALLASFVLSGLIAFAVSGWFYLSLLSRYGSITAFNREPTERFALKNKPASFYIGTGNGNLFTDPVRDSFDNQLLPILYSETWGDYWVFFVVNGKDLRSGKPVQNGNLVEAFNEEGSENWLETNRYEIAPYLGRANLVSTISSSIAILSAIWGFFVALKSIGTRTINTYTLPIILLTTMILSTLIGYLWFLIQYPTLDGDTIKSTYILQIFPLIAILIGLLGTRLSRNRPWLYPSILLVFVLTSVHNLPSMLSNFR